MRVLVSGGGTGGHIYPALAIVDALREVDSSIEVLYAGTADGLEARLVPERGIRFEAIESGGLIRLSLWRKVAGVVRAARGVLQACRLIGAFRPDVVVGTGGFVSGPVLLAAILRGVPTLIQEQNAFPGSTNRWLAPFVDLVCLAFDEGRRYISPRASCLVTGNPVRRELVQLSPEAGFARLGFQPDLPLVYATAGSRGAASLTAAMAEVAARLAADTRFQLLWATGQRYHPEAVERLKQLGVDTEQTSHIRVVPFVSDAPAAFAACSLAIGRSGASTVSELAAVGRPSILVPSSHTTHNHQEYNARLLERAGGAVVIPDAGLTGDRLWRTILELLADEQGLRDMADRARAMGRPNAASEIAQAIRGLVRR
ncbi:MAG: undecaprenyldiphospho-muramoylpentapeptide beta-N-acetylglucosaminyltransferase [Bacillota bacterium]